MLFRQPLKMFFFFYLQQQHDEGGLLSRHGRGGPQDRKLPTAKSGVTAGGTGTARACACAGRAAPDDQHVQKEAGEEPCKAQPVVGACNVFGTKTRGATFGRFCALHERWHEKCTPFAREQEVWKPHPCEPNVQRNAHRSANQCNRARAPGTRQVPLSVNNILDGGPAMRLPPDSTGYPSTAGWVWCDMAPSRGGDVVWKSLDRQTHPMYECTSPHSARTHAFLIFDTPTASDACALQVQSRLRCDSLILLTRYRRLPHNSRCRVFVVLCWTVKRPDRHPRHLPTRGGCTKPLQILQAVGATELLRVGWGSRWKRFFFVLTEIRNILTLAPGACN
jgi:hypothetical protein